MLSHQTKTLEPVLFFSDCRDATEVVKLDDGRCLARICLLAAIDVTAPLFFAFSSETRQNCRCKNPQLSKSSVADVTIVVPAVRDDIRLLLLLDLLRLLLRALQGVIGSSKRNLMV